jgi:hypothetical protein
MTKQWPSDPRDVYILVLQDEIARLKRWIDELVRMHYRLDEEQPE